MSSLHMLWSTGFSPSSMRADGHKGHLLLFTADGWVRCDAAPEGPSRPGAGAG